MIYFSNKVVGGSRSFHPKEKEIVQQQARSLTIRYILRASLLSSVNVLNLHHSHPFRQCSRHSWQDCCVSVRGLCIRL